MKKNILQEPFPRFRSYLHHLVKKSELETIVYLLESDIINDCVYEQNYLFALYALSLLDYLCKKNNYPICNDYDEIRSLKLSSPFYVGDINLVRNNKSEIDNYIPEFAIHNIYEVTINDAC